MTEPTLFETFQYKFLGVEQPPVVEPEPTAFERFRGSFFASPSSSYKKPGRNLDGYLIDEARALCSGHSRHIPDSEREDIVDLTREALSYQFGPKSKPVSERVGIIDDSFCSDNRFQSFVVQHPREKQLITEEQMLDFLFGCWKIAYPVLQFLSRPKIRKWVTIPLAMSFVGVGVERCMTDNNYSQPSSFIASQAAEEVTQGVLNPVLDIVAQEAGYSLPTPSPQTFTNVGRGLVVGHAIDTFVTEPIFDKAEEVYEPFSYKARERRHRELERWRISTKNSIDNFIGW
jgi:hypothetical protein